MSAIKAKAHTKHPFVAIEHRIIDSPAFAAMKPTSKVLLLLVARQLTKDNNGHLQATFAFCQRYGFGSEHTLRGAIAECISHGFLYKTRSHGANKAWTKFAVTWLPVQKKEGLFLSGFKPFAWRDWSPDDKKSTRQKVLDQSGKKCSFTPEHPAETAGNRPAKTADYEPCCHGRGVFDGAGEVGGDWLAAYLARLAARSLAGRQCFQVPERHVAHLAGEVAA